MMLKQARYSRSPKEEMVEDLDEARWWPGWQLICFFGTATPDARDARSPSNANVPAAGEGGERYAQGRWGGGGSPRERAGKSRRSSPFRAEAPPSPPARRGTIGQRPGQMIDGAAPHTQLPWRWRPSRWEGVRRRHTRLVGAFPARQTSNDRQTWLPSMAVLSVQCPKQCPATAPLRAVGPKSSLWCGRHCLRSGELLVEVRVSTAARQAANRSEICRRCTLSTTPPQTPSPLNPRSHGDEALPTPERSDRERSRRPWTFVRFTAPRRATSKSSIGSSDGWRPNRPSKR